MLAHRRPVMARIALAVPSVGVGLAGVRATHRPPGPTLAAVALGSAAVVPGLRPRVCGKRRLLGEAVLGVCATALAPRLRRRRLAALDRARDALELPVAQSLGPPRDGAEGWEEAVAPLMTPLNTFYVTDTNFEHPLVDLPRWTLDVGGLAEAPARFTWADLVALGLEEFDATLVCVHNRLGWDRLGTTRWTGVPMQRVIAEVMPSTRARYPDRGRGRLRDHPSAGTGDGRKPTVVGGAAWLDVRWVIAMAFRRGSSPRACTGSSATSSGFAG